MRLTRALTTALGVVLLGTVAVVHAVDVPVAAVKLIVVDKTIGADQAKAVFVAKDAAVGKGSDTDTAGVSGLLSVVYDASSGQFAMPRGGNWLVNSANVAKYVNRAAPSGGAVKVGIVKPANLLKVVGKGLGDEPLDISAPPSGAVSVVFAVTNGTETIRHCSTFTGCTHKAIAGGTGWKLVCKTGVGDAACSGSVPPVCGDGVVTDGETCDPPGGSCGASLLCDARCLCHLCGNGVTEEGEQCDDGGTASEDGCDAACQLEEAASGGGSVTTDDEGDGATDEDPVETSVTSPVGGTITLVETSLSSEAPAGFGLLDRIVTISAPIASASTPLVLEFLLDQSLLPQGSSAGSIIVFRDGLAVAACTGSPGEAQPDPCVSARATLPDGDVGITVLSSHASDWGFGTNVVLTFSSTPPGGTCGTLRSGGSGGTVVKNLACGATSVGGGASTFREAAFPGGAETQLNGTCDASSCAVTGRSMSETGSNDTCSSTGCRFGPYVPVANGGVSLCFDNTFGAPASGTLDHGLGTFVGSLPLVSAAYLTANAASPCPKCLGGTAGAPLSGVCDPAWSSASGPSPDAGAPCTPVNVAGDTQDCEPSSTLLPGLPLDLNPLTTGTASLSGGGGLFCPSQVTPGAFGCQGSGSTNPICPGGNVPPVADHIEAVGAAAGAITPGPHPIRLASTFCIPAVGGSLAFLVNAAANLPGPGVVTLPGTIEAATATTSTSTTTTTIQPPTGTRLLLRSVSAGGACGSARAGGAGGTVVKTLSCGGTNVGGGDSTFIEAGMPSGGLTEFDVACAGPTCAVSALTAGDTGSNDTCSDGGCRFGPYAPVANGGVSICFDSSFTAPASGTLDTTLGTFVGSLPLASGIMLTGNAASPCPRCLGGTVGAPNSGSCDPTWISAAGNPYPDAGTSCTPTDVAGATYDCSPAGIVLPALPLDLTPTTTGTASLADAGGLFCPSQLTPGAFGCRGSGPSTPACPGGNVPPVVDYVEVVGTPAGALTPGAHPIKLASTFCIPAVSGPSAILVNSAANLPGPGAVSVAATAELIP